MEALLVISVMTFVVGVNFYGDDGGGLSANDLFIRQMETPSRARERLEKEYAKAEADETKALTMGVFLGVAGLIVLIAGWVLIVMGQG